jgi:tetratricopeptide (TPR) repeat protein
MAIDKGTALKTSESYAAIEHLAIDRANLTAALRWSALHDPDPGLRAMAVLSRFFELTGSLSEGRELGEDLLAAAGSSASGRLHGLLGLAHVVYWLAHLDRSAELYEEAVDLAEQLDDKPRLADALIGLAYTYTWQGKRKKAAPLIDRAHEAYSADGNDRGVRLVLTAKATDLWIQQDVASAMEIFAEVLELCREAGDVSEEIVAELVLAAGLLYFGDHDNAIRGILHTLARTTGIGDDGRTTMTLDYMSVAMARTDPEAAARLGGAVQAIASRQGGTVVDLSALGLGSAEELTKDALDAETHRRLWQEGMMFDLAAAVDMAWAWATANSYSAAAVDPERITVAIETNRAD